jgi:hypothetical protein
MSCLKGKITSDNSKLESGDAIILFNVMFDILSELFEVKTNQEVSSISNYLKDAFNLISDEKPNLFTKKINERLLTAYLLLMKRYQNTEDWQRNLITSIDKLNTNDLQSIRYLKINKIFINDVEKFLKEKGV